MIYNKTPQEVIAHFSTSLEGLSDREAEERLRSYGPNKFEEHKRRSIFSILLSQFENSILILLLVAAGISFLLGNNLEAYVILGAVVISVISGAYLEFKADESLAEIRKLMKLKAIVVRDGRKKLIDIEALVPGDIVILQSGQRVPADVYLLEAKNLQVDESVLTGESKPVSKRVGALSGIKEIYELENMVLAGTTVVNGTGKGVVVATGKNTKFGKIAERLASIEGGKSKLKEELSELGRKLTSLSMLIIVIMFFISIVKGFSLYNAFLFAVALAVAAVPEGLLTTLTLIMAISVKEIAKEKALVRRLSAVETLGSTTVIVTDKTGTITAGRLRLVKVIGPLEPAVYSSYAEKTSSGWVGDEVDVAILKYAEQLGKLSLPERVEPFDSKKMYMVGYKNGKAFYKGAPEKLAEFLSDPEGLVKKARVLAGKGYRVLACGTEGKITTLLLFFDPPKPGVREAISETYRMGIDIYMVTGDSKETAESIGRMVGIRGKVEEWKNITTTMLNEIRIIARALPESKLEIVKYLQYKGNVVAAIGDGVNDALALKKANVSVVMGKRGTEVSKQVADIVLLDDNYSTLIRAIELGRRAFENIANFLRFQLTTNVALIILVSLGFLFDIPAFTPLQILWINIIMDGPPAIAQAFESEREVRKQRKAILSVADMFDVLVTALFMAGVTFFAFFISRTFAFHVFVFLQLFNALSSRDLVKPFYHNAFRNKPLVFSIVVLTLLQLALNFVPLLGKVFNLLPISGQMLGFALLLGTLVLLFSEFKKRLLKTKYLNIVYG